MKDKVSAIQFSFKSAFADDVRRIEGYASTSDLDMVSDIVLPTAFQKRLEKFMRNPVVLFNHDTDRPIGKIVSAEVDDKGLKVIAEIAKGTDEADKAWTLIEQGVLKAFSFWARIIDADWSELADGEGWLRVIKEVDLLEVSVVSVPANGMALFAAKSIGDIEFEELGARHEAPDAENTVESTQDALIDAPAVSEEPVCADTEQGAVQDTAQVEIEVEKSAVETVTVSREESPRIYDLVKTLQEVGYESDASKYVVISDKFADIVQEIKTLAVSVTGSKLGGTK